MLSRAESLDLSVMSLIPKRDAYNRGYFIWMYSSRNGLPGAVRDERLSADDLNLIIYGR